MRLRKILPKILPKAEQLGTMLKAAEGFGGGGGEDRLSDLTGLRDNPGGLRARYYVPEGLKQSAPLVVVLHGCTQTAAGYDRGSGWSRLADRHGFALLFPEQTRSNNANLCFNWFVDGDSRRDMGEAASIRSMIEAMAAEFRLDRTRIFVTGLSAGGAMASVMLATYPELFAAGAIIAGIPYGCASNLHEALQCMGGGSHARTPELAASVRRASPHKGKWPRISVWHGSEDRTVAWSNADAIVRQWSALHGLGEGPARTDMVAGYPRRVWLGADGAELIEEYEITGMAHGTPLMPGTGEGQSGEAMPHMLDVGLSSTDRIAAFFGIAPQPRDHPAKRSAAPADPFASASSSTQKVIEDALRSAGLMR